MNRLIILLLMTLTAVGAVTAQASVPKDGKPLNAVRKYQILVTNEDSVKNIKSFNNQLHAFQNEATAQANRGLGLDILTSVTAAFTSKTVDASKGVVGLGVNYLADVIKGDREKWYNKAKEQCHYSHTLSAESAIYDFYATHSTQGAMDPENLKFKGFGCKSYIELKDTPGEGIDVLYLFCKMRRDTAVGIKHIINHSKFLIEVDTLCFNPRYCNLPNDSSGSAESRFDFEKRKNLTLQIKIRVFSSWMNHVTMIANDQLLGEFTITARIDKSKLNEKGYFVFDKNDPDYEKLVSVDGDCFIVPRSFTGTIDASHYTPAWGTGEYRVEMELIEDCEIIDNYYYKQESLADNSDKPKWDKAKWKPEWEEMKACQKKNKGSKKAWDCVIDAYRGTGWVATLTEPVTTVIFDYESKQLGEMFNSIK